MTLEGWVDDVVNPLMETRPWAWLFFIPFIVITTFTVLNLFIGIIVNAMQEEHAKERADELEAERELIQDQTAPLIQEIQGLKAEDRLAAPRIGPTKATLLVKASDLQASLEPGALVARLSRA
jgi:voltage-gated sodium channel